MTWSDPKPITFPSAPDAWARTLWFFGHYDCRVYLDRERYLDVGAGSLGTAQNVKLFSAAPPGRIGAIGRWCEFARCDVLASGEHRNDLPVNIAFNTAPVFSYAADQAGLASRLKPAEPIRIGNGVLVSTGAVIRPGVKIGDGAVIGANAVVGRDVEAFTVVGGVPARKIAERIPTSPWWDLEPVFMAENIAYIQALAMDETAHIRRSPRPRFAIFLEGQRVEFVGFVTDDEKLRPLSDAPPSVTTYVQQALGPGPYYWLADCWA